MSADPRSGSQSTVCTTAGFLSAWKHSPETVHQHQKEDVGRATWQELSKSKRRREDLDPEHLEKCLLS